MNSDAIQYADIQEMPILKEGDVIFRRGVSAESYAVMAIDGSSRYSHVGVIHKTKDGEVGVVHVEPGDNTMDNTIRFEPVKLFWSRNRASKGGIYRIELSELQMSKLSEYLERVYSQKIEFDDGYDLFDTSKIYCTELLYHAYNTVNVEITNGYLDTLLFPKRKPIIFPETILRTRNLKTIFLYYSN